jgi:hypothetical protein
MKFTPGIVASLGIPEGAAGLLMGETDGFAADFTYAVDAKRVAKKVASVVTEYVVDDFIANAGTSPKMVYDASGSLVWAPHNLFINSAAPATQNVTLLVGETYTVTVTGTGSLAGSAGASGTATAASPATFVATTTTGTFTLAGSLTTIQINRGAVATAYLATGAAARIGIALDYHPTTHAARGLVAEPTTTNLLLNSGTLSTQNVTVTATSYWLSFFGTGTVTLSGASTAGPLVGTGANDRASLNFTPTAGTLTLTVAGTVSKAQLENNAFGPSSYIPTFGATVTAGSDNYNFLLSTISALGTEYSIYSRYSSTNNNAVVSSFSITDGTTANYSGLRVMAGVTRLYVVTAGVNVVSINVGSYPSSGAPVHAGAGRLKQNDFAASLNGGAVGTDVVGDLPTGVSKVVFGSNAGATANSVWHVEKMVIVPRAWDDATLITKSAA